VVRPTAIDLPAIQSALRTDGLDGWLLYDFHGMNPIANDVTGAGRQGGHLATRRWFYLIPATGEPRGLVHAIESQTLAHLPGRTRQYAGHAQFEEGLRELLEGHRRVAMEYSPGCAIPYVSRVDAGTVELVRRAGVDVVSSGDLVQRFSAAWDDQAIATHRAASEKLYRIKDQAFAAIAERTRHGNRAAEFDIQQLMVRWFADEAGATRRRSAGSENAGNCITQARDHVFGCDEPVLLISKLTSPGRVCGHHGSFTGARIPDHFARAFATIRRVTRRPAVQQSARGRSAASKSTAPRRSCVRRGTADRFCTGRGTAWAKLFTGTA
jgi:Xaa-Pro aminopeptidase